MVPSLNIILPDTRGAQKKNQYLTRWQAIKILLLGIQVYRDCNLSFNLYLPRSLNPFLSSK